MFTNHERCSHKYIFQIISTILSNLSFHEFRKEIKESKSWASGTESHLAVDASFQGTSMILYFSLSCLQTSKFSVPVEQFMIILLLVSFFSLISVLSKRSLWQACSNFRIFLHNCIACSSVYVSIQNVCPQPSEVSISNSPL